MPNFMYNLGGQVCNKYGEVDPLFIYKMVDNTMEFLPRTEIWKLYHPSGTYPCMAICISADDFILLLTLIRFYLNWPFDRKRVEGLWRTLVHPRVNKWGKFDDLNYRTHTIITDSWFGTAYHYKSRILGSKIEEFPCLVHKLSVILTALQYKWQWKMG